MRRVQLGEMEFIDKQYKEYPPKEPGDVFEYRGRMVLTKEGGRCSKCLFSSYNNGTGKDCGRVGSPGCCAPRVHFVYLDNQMEEL